MEPEINNKETSGDISDQMRADAATRRLVVTPLHDDIFAEELTDDRMVADHLNGVPVANLPIDTEATAAYDSTQQAVSTRHIMLPASIGTIALVTGGVLAYLLLAC